MTLLRNFTTNDERSSFKLDLVLGQSAKWGSSTGARGGGARRFRDPYLRGVRTAASWSMAGPGNNPVQVFAT